MMKHVGFIEGVPDDLYFGETPEKVLDVVSEACRNGDVDLDSDDELVIYKLVETYRYESEPKFKKVGEPKFKKVGK